MGGEGCLTNSTSHLSKSLSTTQYVILSRMESKVHQSSDSFGVPRFLRALCARGGRRRRTNVLGADTLVRQFVHHHQPRRDNRWVPYTSRTLRCVGFNTTAMRGDHTHTTWRSVLKPFQKSYSNPRVKWRTQHPRIRKERECVGHSACLRFTRQFILAPRFSTSSLLGLRAGRYRSSAGTRPSDRSDPSDGRRRPWRLRDALRGMGIRAWAAA